MSLMSVIWHLQIHLSFAEKSTPPPTLASNKRANNRRHPSSPGQRGVLHSQRHPNGADPGETGRGDVPGAAGDARHDGGASRTGAAAEAGDAGAGRRPTDDQDGDDDPTAECDQSGDRVQFATARVASRFSQQPGQGGSESQAAVAGGWLFVFVLNCVWLAGEIN